VKVTVQKLSEVNYTGKDFFNNSERKASSISFDSTNWEYCWFLHIIYSLTVQKGEGFTSVRLSNRVALSKYSTTSFVRSSKLTKWVSIGVWFRPSYRVTVFAGLSPPSPCTDSRRCVTTDEIRVFEIARNISEFVCNVKRNERIQ